MGLAENTEKFVAKPHGKWYSTGKNRREKKDHAVNHVKETNFLRPHHKEEQLTSCPIGRSNTIKTTQRKTKIYVDRQHRRLGGKKALWMACAKSTG